MTNAAGSQAVDQLSGREIRGYELRELIGFGGFGAVYRAHQKSVGREVAIKVILPSLANDPQFIRRFEAEAQLVARLEHPFIVPLFDYWRDSEGAYIVMRLLRGGNLRESMEKQRYPLEDAVKIVEGIAGALTVAHRNNVVHRDLKPENILLDEDANAFLTDFGIAKVTGGDKALETDELEGISGSPGYMSPEQITQEPVTAQTDIYSFGIIVFELLTGAHPFKANNISEYIIKHMNEALPSVMQYDDSLPYELDELIAKATAKIAEERYTDVIDFANDIKRILSITDSAMYAFDDIAEIDFSLITNPYKGLRSFEESDAADFFGREELIQQLLNRLREDDPLNRFLAVIGPSGSGKSSVVKAGLVPALRWGEISGSEEWFIVEIVPGDNPLESLALALETVATSKPDNLQDILNNDAEGLVKAARLMVPAGSDVLIVIDQFEEIFTQLESEKARTHFLELVQTAIKSPESNVRIIITLRADFYDRPLMYEGFGRLLRERTEVVLPLSTTELEATITGPAYRVGLEVDPNLVTKLVADVREEPGALPLLQYVLTEVFERRESNVLTLQAYNESGGALGALARRADELYQAMDEEQQELTRQLFLRLVTLGEGTEDTRRRVMQSELTSLGDPEKMLKVRDLFGRYRLLSLDSDPQTREPTVEVAHEALIREWTILREWLAESRNDIRLQRSLAHAAQEWENSKREVSYLLRGTRLAQYMEWQESASLALGELAKTYLDESIAQRKRLEEAEQKRLEREQRLQRQVRRGLIALLTVMSFAFIIAIAAVIITVQQREQIAIQRDNAQSLALASSANRLNDNGARDIALRLALEASTSSDSPSGQVQRVLGDVVYQPSMIARYEETGAVTGVDISPDTEAFLVATNDGNIVRRSVETGEITQSYDGHALPVVSVAFEDSGQRFVSGSWDQSVMLWDTETGEMLMKYGGFGSRIGHGGAVSAVGITSDGKYILSGSNDGLIYWNADSGEPIWRNDEVVEVNGLDLSSDDLFAVVVGTDGDYLVDLASGEVTMTGSFHDADVLAVDISPDDQKSISSARDGSLYEWDLQTGRSELLTAPDGHILAVNSVKYTPDGRNVLSASTDNTLILWDLTSGEIVLNFGANESYARHTEPVNTVAISADGSFAISGSADETSIMWSLVAGQIIQEFAPHEESVILAQYDANRDEVVSVGGDNTLHIVNATTGEVRVEQPLELPDFVIISASLHSDGQRLFLGGESGALAVIDLNDVSVLEVIEAHDDTISDIVLDASGEILLTTSEDNTAKLWRVNDLSLLHTLQGHDRRILVGELSDDGTIAITGSADRTAIVWDVETGEQRQLIEVDLRRIVAIDTSPQNQFAMIAADDGQIFIWSLENAELVGQLESNLENTDVRALSALFMNDGQYIVSSLDSQLIMWNVENGGAIRVIPIDDIADEPVLVLSKGKNAGELVAGTRDGRVFTLHFPDIQGLITWAYENRFVPELTCLEQEQLGIDIGTCEETEFSGEVDESTTSDG